MRSQSQFDVLVTTVLWVGGFFQLLGSVQSCPCSQLTWRRMSKNISLPDYLCLFLLSKKRLAANCREGQVLRKIGK